MPLRIPSITQVNSELWQIIQGPVAISIGAIASENPSGIGAVLASIGLTDGNIEMNLNIESTQLSSDQLFNPHSNVEISWGIQAALSLDQANIWNLALALSYDQDAVSSSSMLTINGQLPSPFRCVRIEHEAARNEADDSIATEYTDLWKSKIIPSSAIVHGRLAKTTLPIIINAVANANDIAGAILVSAVITRPLYEAIFFILRGLWVGDSSFVTSVDNSFRLLYVGLHSTSAVANNITINLDSALGSDYDTTLHTFYGGATDYFYQFDVGAIFEEDDEILIVGNAGAGNICYYTICYVIE